MIVPFLLSWSAPIVPADLLGWRIYAGPPGRPGGVRGRCVALACRPEETQVEFLIEEGAYTFTICRLFRWGEENWRTAFRTEIVVSGRRVDPPANLASPAIAHIAGADTVRLRADHVAADEPDTLIEVIEGSSPSTGRMVSRTLQVREAADARQMPADIPSRGMQVHGSGRAASRTLWMRAITPLGIPCGTPTSFSVPYFDRPNTARVEICSLVSGALSGITSPGATDQWDLSGGAIIVRRKPVVSAATNANGWGTVASGILSGTPVATKWLPEAAVESDEKDLGVSRPFILEWWDDLERASGTALMRPVRTMKFPINPNAHDALQASRPGPAWYGREYTQAGAPRRPIEESRWEVKYGDSSPISMGYRPAIHGEQIKARYVRVRRIMRDPIGLHQLQVTALKVEAIYPYHLDQGETEITSPNSSITVTTRNNPATGSPDLFASQLIPVVTPKALGAWWPRVTAVSPSAGTFTVQLQNAAGVAYTSGGTFYWHVQGY